MNTLSVSHIIVDDWPSLYHNLVSLRSFIYLKVQPEHFTQVEVWILKCFYLFFNLYFNSIVDLLLHINFLLHNPRLANILLSDKCYHILESHLTLEFFDELMVRFQSGAQMLSLQTKLKSSPSTAMLDSWYELFCQMWHCATHLIFIPPLPGRKCIWKKRLCTVISFYTQHANWGL